MSLFSRVTGSARGASRSWRPLSVLATLLSLCGVEARAADWYVNAAVCPFSGIGTQLFPFCRISSALAVAAAGDTIWITQGYYPENLIIQRSVRLRGLGSPTSTIIDGSLNGRSTIAILGGPTGANPVWLQQLTVQRGAFRSTTQTGAGGIDITGGSLICTDVVLRDCRSGSVGRSDGFGGALGARQSRVQLVRTRIESSSCTFYGGAIRVASSTLEMAESTIDGCRSDYFGGGIYATDSDVALRDSVIQRCSAGVTTGPGPLFGEGGAVRVWGGTATFDRVSFAFCSAQTQPPWALVSKGGAISGTALLALRISSCIFRLNAAEIGTAVFLSGAQGPAVVTHSTFYGQYSILGPTTGVLVSQSPGTSVDHCLSWGNVFNTFDGATASYSCILGGQTGTGNFSADPLCVNAPAGDFRLRSGSPCIDAGNPGTYSRGLDRRGFPRTLDGDLDLSLVPDPGAHEHGNCEITISSPARRGGTCYVVSGGRYGLVFIRFLSTSFREQPVYPYGSLFADAAGFAAPYLQIGVIANVQQYVLPPELPVPLDLYVQDFAFDPATFAGNFSNPAVLQVR